VHCDLTIDIRIAISHNKFYVSHQYLIHVSVALTIFRPQTHVASIDGTNKICCG